MADTPEEMTQESLSIGDKIADIVIRDVDYARSYGREPEYTAEHVVDNIADRIDSSDRELEIARVRNYADRELGTLLVPFVDRFLKLVRREDFRQIENLPLLRVGANDLRLEVPIDAGNQRATVSIVARMRAILSDPELRRTSELDERGGAYQ